MLCILSRMGPSPAAGGRIGQESARFRQPVASHRHGAGPQVLRLFGNRTAMSCAFCAGARITSRRDAIRAFDVSDSRASRYWHASYDRTRFLLALEPKEFVDDPYLSEHILDRDPEAWEIFSKVSRRMEAEGA